MFSTKFVIFPHSSMSFMGKTSAGRGKISDTITKQNDPSEKSSEMLLKEIRYLKEMFAFTFLPTGLIRTIIEPFSRIVIQNQHRQFHVPWSWIKIVLWNRKQSQKFDRVNVYGFVSQK